MVNPRYSAP